MRMTGNFSLLRLKIPLLLSERTSWSQWRERTLGRKWGAGYCSGPGHLSVGFPGAQLGFLLGGHSQAVEGALDV